MNRFCIFLTNRASIIGLRPSAEYKFVVYAENSVSEQSDIESSSSVDVVTDDAGIIWGL